MVSPAWMRFSTRARLRPSSCAAYGLSQKPGADMSRSISPSDFRAEARSKVAPNAGEAFFEIGDLREGVFFHGFFLVIIARSTAATATHANQSPNLTYAVTDCLG